MAAGVGEECEGSIVSNSSQLNGLFALARCEARYERWREGGCRESGKGKRLVGLA